MSSRNCISFSKYFSAIRSFFVMPSYQDIMSPCQWVLQSICDLVIMLLWIMVRQHSVVLSWYGLINWPARFSSWIYTFTHKNFLVGTALVPFVIISLRQQVQVKLSSGQHLIKPCRHGLRAWKKSIFVSIDRLTDLLEILLFTYQVSARWFTLKIFPLN